MAGMAWCSCCGKTLGEKHGEFTDEHNDQIAQL
jgi:hypothetical protein